LFFSKFQVDQDIHVMIIYKDKQIDTKTYLKTLQKKRSKENDQIRLNDDNLNFVFLSTDQLCIVVEFLEDSPS